MSFLFPCGAYKKGLMFVDLYNEPVSRSELWELVFKCPLVNLGGETTRDISLFRGFIWFHSLLSLGSV
jgi:hypothetical protein